MPRQPHAHIAVLIALTLGSLSCRQPTTAEGPAAPPPLADRLRVPAPPFTIRSSHPGDDSTVLALVDGQTGERARGFTSAPSGGQQEIEFLLGAPTSIVGLRVHWGDRRNTSRSIRVLAGDERSQYASLVEGGDSAGWLAPEPGPVTEMRFPSVRSTRLRLVQDVGSGPRGRGDIFSAVEIEPIVAGAEDWPRAGVRCDPDEPLIGWALQDDNPLSAVHWQSGCALEAEFPEPVLAAELALEVAQVAERGSASELAALALGLEGVLLRGDAEPVPLEAPELVLSQRGLAAGLVRLRWPLPSEVEGVTGIRLRRSDAEAVFAATDLHLWSEAQEHQASGVRPEEVEPAPPSRGLPAVLGLPGDSGEAAFTPGGTFLWRPSSSPAEGQLDPAPGLMALLGLGLDGVPLRALPLTFRSGGLGLLDIRWESSTDSLRLDGQAFVTPLPPGEEGTLVIDLRLHNTSAERVSGRLDAGLAFADGGLPLAARWNQIEHDGRQIVSLPGDRVLIEFPGEAVIGGARVVPELPVHLPYDLDPGSWVDFRIRIPRDPTGLERQRRAQVFTQLDERNAARAAWLEAMAERVDIELPDEELSRQLHVWIAQLLLLEDRGQLTAGSFPSRFEGSGDPRVLAEVISALAHWGLAERARLQFERALTRPPRAGSGWGLLQRAAALSTLDTLSRLSLDAGLWLPWSDQLIADNVGALSLARRPEGGLEGRRPAQLVSRPGEDPSADRWLVRGLRAGARLVSIGGGEQRQAALQAEIEEHEGLIAAVERGPLEVFERLAEQRALLAGGAVPARSAGTHIEPHSGTGWWREEPLGPVLAGESGWPDPLATVFALMELRHQLLSESPEALVVLGGTPLSWWEGAGTLRFSGLPIDGGAVDLRLDPDAEEGAQLDLRIRGSRPEELRLRLPPGRYRVDGRTQQVDDGWLRLSPCPEQLELTALP